MSTRTRSHTLSALILIVSCSGLTATLAEDLTVSSDTIWPAGTYTYDNVVVEAGATLTVQGDPGTGTGVTVNAQNLTVEAGGSISADHQGYPAGEGPGVGAPTSGGDYGNGGTYGGRGAGSPDVEPYGSAAAPVDLGSGGSGAGAGGGALRLDVAGTLTVDGTLTAHGQESRGGGSGGSIYITTSAFAGSGLISANGGGGDYWGDSGGGGRVAVYYESNTFSGTVEAQGGENATVTGEDGTVGLFDVSDPDHVDLYAGHAWRFEAVDAVDGSIEYENITLVDAQVTIREDLVVSAVDTFTMTSSTKADDASSLGLYSTQGTIHITAGHLAIDEGCAISGDAKGYPANEGPGAPTAPQGGDQANAGSHGGRGANQYDVPPYGSATAPVTLGSGGTHSAGGGAIQLEVSGTLTVDGMISANGADSAGAGAGGSVFVSTGTLAGAGAIRANGGHGGTFWDGGGGGRVAVNYSTNTFTGALEAAGGGGGSAGQDGTVGLFDVSDPDHVDFYAGHAWRFQINDADAGVLLYENIFLEGSSVTLEAGLSRVEAANAIVLASAAKQGGTPSTLELYDDTGSIYLVAANLTVAADCAISMLGKGYGINEGPGAPPAPQGGDQANGGTHGGRADDAGDVAPYGSETFPVTLGSGGTQSSGGGAIRIEATDTLTVDGTISADGADSGGAGAGGSVLVSTATLAGAGAIRANGGHGGTFWDGGGGGRVAVYFGENDFLGTIEAAGGGGGSPGEDGSVYLERQIPLALGDTFEDEAEPFVQYMFRLDWDEEISDVALVRLTPIDAPGDWSLLGRFNQQPTESQYDWSSVGPTLDAPPSYDMLVPLTTAGPYFFGVYYEVWSKQGPTFRVECVTAPEYYVARLDLGSGGSEGMTTRRFTGVGFGDAARVELRHATTGAVLGSYAPLLWDSTSMTIQFDLTGIDPQVVDVAIVWPDSHEEVWEDAFEVTAEVSAEISLDLEFPEVMRPLRKYTCWVTCTNSGGTDVPAPLLYLTSEQGLGMRVSTEEPFERRDVLLLALNDEAPEGVLPTGASVRIPVQFIAEGGAHDPIEFNVSAIDEDTSAVPWGTIQGEVQPEGVSADAWDVIWSRLATEMGGTWASLADRLRDTAEELAARNEVVYDAGRLFALELAAAAADRGDMAAAYSATDAACLAFDFGRIARNAIDCRFEDGPFGLGWGHSFQYRLVAADSETVEIWEPGGTVRRFVMKADGTWQAPKWGRATLEAVTGGYEVTEPGGVVWAYDDEGQLTSITDANGNSITLTYTGDDLTTIAHSNTETFTLAYDGNGHVTTLTDHNGDETTYAYTGDLLTSVTDPDSNTTQYSYEMSASPSQYALTDVAYPAGTHEYMTYDSAGRPAGYSLDGGAEAVTYSYPLPGTIVTQDAAGETSTAVYDPDGALVEYTDALSKVAAFGYTEDDRTNWSVAPDGTVTQTTFDAEGYPIASTDAAGNEIAASYAPSLGAPNWLRDGNWNRKELGFDADGNLTSVTFPDSSALQFGHDSQGRITTYTNRRGDVITLTYDTEGHVLSKETVPASKQQAAVTITADYNEDGLPTRVGDGTDDVQLSWRNSHQLELYQDVNGNTLEYVQNASMQVVQIIRDAASTIDYIRDVAGRVNEVRHNGSLIMAYTYNDRGQVERAERGNGTYTRYTYGLDNEVEAIAHCRADDSVYDRFTYTPDDFGRAASEASLRAGTTAISYDSADRAQRVDYPGGLFDEITYDAAHNWTSALNETGRRAYESNTMNQYTRVDGAARSYDADGNLTLDASNEYEFTAANRLSRVTARSGSDMWTYTTNALGQRDSETHNGATTRLLRDPLADGRLAAKYDDGGALESEYVYGLGMAARVDHDGSVRYFHHDRAGNTRHLTDENGDVVGEYEWRAFGEPRTSSGEATEFGFRGASGARTQGHGLLEMNGRAYDPAVGRFADADSAAAGGRSHPYNFAQNDPINLEGASEALSDMSNLAFGFLDEAYDLLRQTAHAAKEPFSTTPDNSGAKISGPPAGFGAGGRSGGARAPGTGTGTGAGRISGRGPGRTHGPRKGTGPGGPTGPRRVSPPAGPKRGVGPGPGPGAGGRRIGPGPGGRSTGPGPGPGGRSAGPGPGPAGGRSGPGPGPGGGRSGGAASGGGAAAGSAGAHGPTGPGAGRAGSIVIPGDPNEKAGPAGKGPDKIVEVDEVLNYTVYFENVPTASAPAQEVFVTDQLDPDLDWSTFQLTEITWGDYTVPIDAGKSSLSTRMTVSDHREGKDTSWWVDVDAALDGGTGEVTWTFRTLDPKTADLPEDALAGFLPPNDDTGRGEGHVSFSIMLNADTALGTLITNEAAIVFDTESTINTNQVSNTVGEIALGDVDYNGSVDAVDVQSVINQALGIETGLDCDLNEDDVVNAVDVQLVINAALGL